MGGKYITEFVIVSKLELDRKSEQEGKKMTEVVCREDKLGGCCTSSVLGSLIIKLRRETEVRWRQKGGRVVDSVRLFAMLSERRTFNCCTEMLPRYSAPLFTLLSISRKLELMSSSCSTNRRQQRMTGWKLRGRKERRGAVGGPCVD